MKNFPAVIAPLLLFLLTLSSCEIIGGIFKAGFWTAIILVAIVVIFILWLVNRGKS